MYFSKTRKIHTKVSNFLSHFQHYAMHALLILQNPPDYNPHSHGVLRHVMCTHKSGVRRVCHTFFTISQSIPCPLTTFFVPLGQNSTKLCKKHAHQYVHMQTRIAKFIIT